MLKKWLPNWLNGLIVGCVLFANLIIFGALVLTLGLVKLVLPIPVVSKLLHSAYTVSYTHLTLPTKRIV